MADDVAQTGANRKGGITITVRRAAGVEEGDLAAVTIGGNTITLMQRKLVDESQVCFRTKAWQRCE